MGIEGITYGDKVIVRKKGVLHDVVECVSMRGTQARFRRLGTAMLATGKFVGKDDLYAYKASEQEIGEAKAELQRRRDETEAEETARWNAAYEALPEEIKIARSVRWFFDQATEEHVAKMPMEMLRSLKAWIDENSAVS